MATESLTMEQTRQAAHCNCVVCSPNNHLGFNVKFELADDGSVAATFDCAPQYQGYDRLLHGGVISCLLDGAMTNCLFAHGRHALTAELKVRFHEPVRVAQSARVRAWIVRNTPQLVILESEIVQDERVKVTGQGKFMGRAPTIE
jgi:uncharacterized protein (TIGR00369 family)